MYIHTEAMRSDKYGNEVRKKASTDTYERSKPISQWNLVKLLLQNVKCKDTFIFSANSDTFDFC